MLPISQLRLGFNDAENYKRRENKLFFNSIFIQNEALDAICSPEISFVIGEKGTGKTAYAVYLENNDYKNTHARVRYIRETEYLKFMEMKKARDLTLSDYVSIWKVIIYLLITDQVGSSSSSLSKLQRFIKFPRLKRVIDSFYNKAFSPEIHYAMEFAKESERSVDLLAGDDASLKIGSKEASTSTKTRYQNELLLIQQAFKDGLGELKLERNQVLFIDGIDIRPDGVEFSDYLECIKGLANAVWSLNVDVFSNFRDSPGRIRVVLLIRPDIFASLGLQNQNSKVKDNSVVLSWLTEYAQHRSSGLFRVADRLLQVEQDPQPLQNAAWDYYFPFNAPRIEDEDILRQSGYSSFISVLRLSFYRPRDVLALLDILKTAIGPRGKMLGSTFTSEDFLNPHFTRDYSEYILGEVKDQLAFYYPIEDWNSFVQFFHCLNGSSTFTYQEFEQAFHAFKQFFIRNDKKLPDFAKSSDAFLQFLYELNVISWVAESVHSGKRFYGFCFRERSSVVIAPKVRIGSSYVIHAGLRKALDLGKRFERPRDAGPKGYTIT